MDVLTAIALTVIVAAVWHFSLVAGAEKRLIDRTHERDRALARIEALEEMLDNVRANALNVPAPVRTPDPVLEPLPEEIRAELDEIDDVAARAEMEAEIRTLIEGNPMVDPAIVARQVLGGPPHA